MTPQTHAAMTPERIAEIELHARRMRAEAMASMAAAAVAVVRRWIVSAKPTATTPPRHA